MLRIRHEQMLELEQARERQVVNELVDELFQEYPRLPGLRERVENATERARKYGLRQPDDLHWFASLDLRRGAAWERQPGFEWALSELDAPELDAIGRRFRVEKGLRRWHQDAE